MKSMKKTGKRFFALFMSLVMALGIMQTTAFAAREYKVPVYAVVVDGNNKVVSVNPMTSTNWSGRTDEATSTSKIDYWTWSPSGSGYNLESVGATSTNVNCWPYLVWPGKLWNISNYTYKGYAKLSWAPYQGLTVKPSGSTYEWKYNNGETLYVTNATGTYLAYVFQAKAATYTLNYNANGGTGAPASQSASSTTGSYTFTISSTVPTKAGYTFKGWSTSSSATSASYQPGNTINVTGTTTLYAVWEAAPVKEAEKSGTAQLQVLKTFEGADKPSSFYMTYSITNTAVGGNQGRGTLLFTELVPGLYSANVNYPTWTFTGNWTVAEKAGYDSVITLTERGADISGKDLTITADGATVSGNTITYKVGAQATGGGMLEITNSYTGTVQPAPETPVTHKSIQVENSTGGWDDVHVDEETGMTDPIAAGSHVKYTITVTNPGSVDYQELSIVDMMDSELTLTPNSTQTWLVVNGVETPIVGPDITTTGGTMQTWSVTDTVPAGAHVKITYEADVGPYQISSMDNSLTATVILPQPINSAAYGYSAQSESAPNAYSSTAVVRLVTKAPANDGNKDVSPTSDAESADEISGLAR